MSNDIEKLRELKQDFIARVISCGIQYGACGQISYALNKAIDALDAPASGAALRGELPPLPEALYLGGDEAYGDVVRGYVADQMREYGAACHALGRGAAVRDYIENGSAIAHQPPKEALKEPEIMAIYESLEEQLGIGFSEPDPIKFARAIEAATGPNNALVEALQLIMAMPRGSSGRIIIDRAEEVKLRAALSAAGVTLKGE